MMHRSKKLLGSRDQEYCNEKRPVNVRVDGTAHLAELFPRPGMLTNTSHHGGSVRVRREAYFSDALRCMRKVPPQIMGPAVFLASQVPISQLSGKWLFHPLTEDRALSENPVYRELSRSDGLLPSRGRRFAPSVMTGNKRLTRVCFLESGPSWGPGRTASADGASNLPQATLEVLEGISLLLNRYSNPCLRSDSQTTLGISGRSPPPVCLGRSESLAYLRPDALLLQAAPSRRYRSAASLGSACESRPGLHIRPTAQAEAKRDKSRRPGRRAGLGPGKVFVRR
jgi:hypothetical protein